MDALIELFTGMNRLAPGSVQTTQTAYRIATNDRHVESIVDFGCGNGAATLPLAELSDANITAVDNCSAFVDYLQQRVVEAGLKERVSVENRSMADPWPEGKQFDLIWCEGAVYNLGLDQALKQWKRLLSPGGRIAVSDLVWIKQKPDPVIAEYWRENGLEVIHRDQVERRFKEHGYRCFGWFQYSNHDWDNYYRPVIEQIHPWLEATGVSEEKRQLAETFQQEIRMRTDFGDQFDYVFFIAEV